MLRNKSFKLRILPLLLTLLLLLTVGCVKQPGPQAPDGAGAGDGEAGQGEEGSTPLVIRSENPVLADSQKVLEELEKEVAELLEILNSMDTIEEGDLDF